MTGHVRQRAPGRWELRVYVGRDPLTGRKKYATRTIDAAGDLSHVVLRPSSLIWPRARWHDLVAVAVRDVGLHAATCDHDRVRCSVTGAVVSPRCGGPCAYREANR